MYGINPLRNYKTAHRLHCNLVILPIIITYINNNPNRNRTDIPTVKLWCLNHCTMRSIKIQRALSRGRYPPGISNRALSAADILLNYWAGKARTPISRHQKSVTYQLVNSPIKPEKAESGSRPFSVRNAQRSELLTW